MQKRRSSSTVPYGYKLSEADPKYLEEIPEQLKVLEEVKPLVVNRAISLRDGAAWISHKTGRPLSHSGLKKIIDNERLGRESRQVSEGL
jgi:hypothetical protein|tara:strand:+ start:362 stop:628 length:267 start_codon:yes stop_codon:yes gene_type:complete